MKELTTKKLKKMSVTDLESLADTMATRLMWLHSTGKDETEPETYKRLAGEILHVSNIIEEKLINKKQTKVNYGK